MREILFKAKRSDNGEWVEGYYSKSPDPMFAFLKDFIFAPYFDEETECGYDNGYKIDINTLCQYTGLTDENGNKIWENDIVHLFGQDTLNGYDWKAVVEFGNPNSLYSWGYQLKPIGNFEHNRDILCWIDMEEVNIYCEVIGNIFDNPELIGGDTYAET